MKLYPPIIEGTIPACAGTTIVVPFSLNRAVSFADVKSIVLKIKTVQGGMDVNAEPVYISNTDWKDTLKAIFPTTNLSLTVGQYYKLQIAFVNETDEVGYYSTVGVMKYTNKPSLSLDSDDGENFTAIYTQSNDYAEKLYSSNFILSDDYGNILKDYGEELHNVAEDKKSNEAKINFIVDYPLKPDEVYNLRWNLTTINGYKDTTDFDFMFQDVAVSSEEVVKAENDFEEGRINISWKAPKSGEYRILRAADNEDFIWRPVGEVSTTAAGTTYSFLWRDNTVEQGVAYKYAVQDDNIRYESKAIMADFEDIFLSDGERQLKVRFKPGVSSFKDSIPESKQETIGHKQPFIFRNGRVKYKEFPITGLISFQMDEHKLFIDIGRPEENKYREATPTKNTTILHNPTQLSKENFYTERQFKLEVQAWLENGKKKLFRSPAEGNYIVQLMGVSLSPNDTLSRMIHTFQATAEEVADYNYKNLVEFNLLEMRKK